MKRIQFEQGSDLWLEFRRGKISASKTGIILGHSIYQTPFQLYEEEMGLRDPQPQRAHMTRGLEIEDHVRDWFRDKYGIKVKPAVVQHATNPIFIASLDGLSADDETIVEIKNNNESYHLMAKDGILPESYKAQVQFQIFVCDLPMAYYISHRHEECIVVLVKRDQSYIDDMVAKCLDFKRRLNEFDPPPLMDRDYEDLKHDSDLEKDIMLYNTDMRAMQFLKERMERKLKDIKERIGDKSAMGAGWKYTKYKVKGRVDWDAVEELKQIDLNKYRKAESVSFRLTIE